MSKLDEQISERFQEWELRGRGWHVFDAPVIPEPPFRPFFGHYLPDAPPQDDGRKSTVLSSFIQKLSRKLSTDPPPPVAVPLIEAEPEARMLIRESFVELQTCLPAELDIDHEAFEHFLRSLSLCHEPIAFELLGLSQNITAQFAVHPDDAGLVRRQLQAYFPEAVFQPPQSSLDRTWESCQGDEILAAEFGLEREFMLPLATGGRCPNLSTPPIGELDPFIGIIGALSELRQGEFGLFQVLFQPAQHPWAKSITRSVARADGTPFFVNRPELAEAAESKVSKPLYAAVVRILVKSQRQERTLRIACDLSGSLRVFADPSGNQLIPLSNEDYAFEEHIEDVLRRQSRRSGMLLNSDELIGFVHIPSNDVRSTEFKRDAGNTKRAPSPVHHTSGVLLGQNVHARESKEVRLNPEQRVRHTHIIGASGTGKSTLLFNLISQDIQNGEGVALLDPHGDLIDRVLGMIPPHRIDDVILVDPSDEQFSVGFNVLSAHSDLEKNLLASDLVSVFERLSATWGDQMGSVLSNAIHVFLDSSRRETLAELRRFLIEPSFRAEFLKTVEDPALLYYWQKAFPQLAGNKSIGPVLTRLDTFLGPKPIRYMVSQAENRLDFADIMDSGKIFLAKLSHGLLGRENSYLLGTLLVSKFQQLAMARQSKQTALRRNFWIYIDEFHNFITPSMAEILSGARKYRIGLVLAHQELRQLQRDSEVASAVLSNPYTRVCFRVGDDDARKLSSGFTSFDESNLQNLGTGEAIARIERSDFDFNLRVPCPAEPGETEAARRRDEVITASRKKYGKARTEIEADLKSAVAATLKSEPPPKPTRVPPPVVTPALEPAKIPEAPKLTVSEKEITDAKSETEAPRDLGRGGPDHKALQKRIQAEAHALGFRADVEWQVEDKSNKAADVVLRNGGEPLAVEISVNTPVGHEFQNVEKCLSAGFNRVAIISSSAEHLKAIAEAVKAGLSPEQAEKVSYHSPDEFIAELKRLAQEAAKSAKPPMPQESVTRGYKVRGHAPTLSAAELKAKEDMAIKLMAEMMKRKAA
jgi:hypothetical protein